LSKILITSIGNGSYNKETKRREYEKAKYYIDGHRDETVETEYIYNAIKRFRAVDKCVFVGTCGSNWHLLYEYLHDSGNLVGQSYDENYSLSLLEKFDEKHRACKDVQEFRRALEQLKLSMGDFCADIVVLKYGLTTEELLENFKLLASISNIMKEGDSIIFDITHSFRSLAVYELLVINYLRYILGKSVNIDSVTYGMFEYKSENENLVPIVDLSQLVNTMEWMKAAEEYKRFGTARLLAELIENNPVIKNQFEAEEIEALKRLGGLAISTNGIREFKLMIKNCHKINSDISKGIIEENFAFGFIFSDLIKRFGDKTNDDMLLLFELSKWHHEKGRYMESAICVVESFLNYCEKLTGIPKDANDSPLRDNIKSASREHNPNQIVAQFLHKYNKARLIRNKLLHGEELSEKKVCELMELGKYFSKVYRKDFKGNIDNEKALKNSLIF